MKLTHALVFTIFFKTCFSISEENISKVICSMSRFKYANIFVGTLRNPIKLSKKLRKKCDIKIKIVDDAQKFEDVDMISFAEYDKENEGNLVTFSKNYDPQFILTAVFFEKKYVIRKLNLIFIF